MKHAQKVTADACAEESDHGFYLPAARVNDWHSHGVLTSHFMNTFSVMAPAFERFITLSVKHYQPLVESTPLKTSIAAMLIQEAGHHREHRHYNGLIEEVGLPGRGLERLARTMLDTVLMRPWITPSFRLAVAMMLEHQAALASTVTLNSPALLEGSLRGYARLWSWHAREETDHRSVAYNLWIEVMGRDLRSYLIRVSGGACAAVLTFTVAAAIFARLLAADKNLSIGNLALKRFLRFHYGPGGLVIGSARLWFRYFLPGFHPGMYDRISS
ncbi:metal-dependent hydrolase [Pseudomonas viridiflava]|uniref:metal-dependent hydrolase n=1 Tax=Pseudomonas viridiflava TaxID=33069 RepID=UPI000F041724|nr:metal-dependent hydrolase [Pseudomonas viridiflava]